MRTEELRVMGDGGWGGEEGAQVEGKMLKSLALRRREVFLR